MTDSDDGPALEKGDYVTVKGTSEMGRVVGLGASPGTWKVRIMDDSRGDHETELAEDSLAVTY